MDGFYSLTDLSPSKENLCRWDDVTEHEESSLGCERDISETGQMYCCVEVQGVMVMTCMDKKSVSLIYTFHSDTMIAVSKRGK
jgi:hypothetical protein